MKLFLISALCFFILFIYCSLRVAHECDEYDSYDEENKIESTKK